MKLIIVRPNYEITTRYLFAWAEEVIKLAKEKGVEVFDLAKDKANKNELVSRIKKIQPELVFLNGHGKDDCVFGQNDKVLIKANENHKVLNKLITYALSCSVAKVLGKKIAQAPKTFFIGYKDKFIFVIDAKYISKPKEDPKAKPFMQSSNQAMISLLKGHTPKEASKRSKEKFKENLKLLSSESDADSLQIAQCLWWNMKHQVCLGNKD